MKICTNLRRIALFSLSMVLSMGFLIAQERSITGKVTAESGDPMPGVNIVVKGTASGVITDANGAYSIRVPGPETSLVFSSVGSVTQEVIVGAQSVIDVVLIEDIQALQEVVVVGYTSSRKRDITGSVGVVEPTKLTAIPSGNVSNQLQGRTSGVTVLGSGAPDESAKVRIRGFSSFENNDPLYIVDGVPTQDISSMNPNDVASISVLKDAGAASIYGSRASNGVIIVTTKKGSKGIKVTYDMYYGSQDPGKGTKDELCTAQEYANLQWLVYDNDGTIENHPIYGQSTNAAPTMPSWAANTDWYDAVTNPAPIQNHDLTLSGGNDKANFFAGLGYFNRQGIIIESYAQRYTARFNSDFTFLNDRVKVGENLTLAFRHNLGVANLQEGSPIQMGPYRAQSIVPVKWTGDPYVGLSHTFVAGDYGGTGIIARLGNNSNVVANQERGKDNNYHDIRMIGNLFVDIKLMEGLNFRSTAGGTWNNGYGVGYNFATYENSENTATPSLNENAYYGSDWVWTNSLTFDKVFGNHKINAVVGYEAVKYGMGRNISASRAGYFSNAVDFRTLTNGANITAANSDFYTPTSLVSMFARADYGFRDKYLISATVRRDGSSRFSADDRYGIFPSVSLAWRISDEAFMKGIGWISDLKLRGSYGTMGNQLAIDPRNQFYLFGGSQNQSFYDINGTMTSSVQGFRPTRIGNPDAKWETNITTNVGFEGTFWNNKLGVVFDWYQKKTEDLLFPLELPGTAGGADVPYVNLASMQNSGIDAEVSFKNSWGDFGVNVSWLFTTYKNEITKIAEGVDFFDSGGSRIGAFNRNMVGHPMSSFYGYQVMGLFQSPSEVSSAPTQDGAAPGFFRFANIDDSDNAITPTDRTFIGDPNPDFTSGLNLAFTYKNVDLTAFLYGSFGNDIFNWNTWWIDFWPSFQGQKSKALLNESWTTERTGASVPKASNTSNFSTNTQSCSYYIEKGTFVRLKNLQLGFTFPQSLISKINLTSLRVYVQGINLVTFTDYSGLDPELGGDDRNFGVDAGNYPNVKQYIFGINLVL